MSNDQFEVPEPTYEWVDRHNERAGNLQRAHDKAGGLWGIVPGLVYCGAIVLLSTVLGAEIARLFVGQSMLLQIIGWGCVAVVGLSAIASFYGKGAVYKSERQQRLGMFFWALELCALTIGLLVAVADAFGFVGIVLDVARFFGFMSVVIAAFGWGILRWASPEWKVISEQNKSDADLAIKLAELDSQYAMSDEMIKLRMLAAYQKARGNALAAVRTVPLIETPKQSLLDKVKAQLGVDADDDDNKSDLTVGDMASMSPEQFAVLAALLQQWQTANGPDAEEVRANGHTPKA
ncbi:hypothetical protein TFLX_04027 [Thermoflexales bacterium]|nr:hypothetical protein TFLX_04027 [Thermoflexales bacterium]